MDKPYYQDEWVTHYCDDALSVLSGLPDSSIDLLATDPPYGIGFMGKDWDRALPDKRVWTECLRVLRAGSFAFVMSIPRSDCLSRMIISLEDAGFWVDFTPIFWAYASGFPKAQNIGKAVDKRLGVYVEGEKLPSSRENRTGEYYPAFHQTTAPNLQSPQAKALDGSYGGFQPKPAVEVIIVAMKPLSEKTFVDQALKNRKGITWLDDGRIPYESGDLEETEKKRDSFKNSRDGFQDEFVGGKPDNYKNKLQTTGRFPANLLVSDDVLNDGKVLTTPQYKTEGNPTINNWTQNDRSSSRFNQIADSGSFSKFFDLDKWAQKTFPFLIVPKASKSEKNKGLDYEPQPIVGRDEGQDVRNVPQKARSTPRINQHPTVKPLKLMSYLITLGSRQGDVVLDPFSGSGTTMLASKLLNRQCIGIEVEEKYCEIAANRCRQMVMKLT